MIYLSKSGMITQSQSIFVNNINGTISTFSHDNYNASGWVHKQHTHSHAIAVNEVDGYTDDVHIPTMYVVANEVNGMIHMCILT
mgnify:CR=1 FL=1